MGVSCFIAIFLGALASTECIDLTNTSDKWLGLKYGIDPDQPYNPIAESPLDKKAALSKTEHETVFNNAII
jgi:hypothetical protein